MRNLSTRLAALVVALAALTLIGAPSAQAADPIPVAAIPAPVQHDDCGAEIRDGGGPNDYVGYSWDHWTIKKVTGASASLFWLNDGSGYVVRYDPKPGYYFPEGVVQRVWTFPAFTNEPCI